MNYRNAKRNENNSIDCEINHPIYGWVPFTCDPRDTESALDVSTLYAAMDTDPNTAPYVYVQPSPLTREQISLLRAEAYSVEADPLFFKSQRGEATVEEWLAKIDEIKIRYPYSEVIA